MKKNLRILLIEDDDNKRIVSILAWLPEDVRTIDVAEFDNVLGCLDQVRELNACIRQDHDQQNLDATSTDTQFSGSRVIAVINKMLPTDMPILINSMNFAKTSEIEQNLETAGFSVTRTALSEINHEHLISWLGWVT